MNIYAIIAILAFALFVLVLYKTSIKLKEIKAQTVVPTNRVGGINIAQLKALSEQTDDIVIKEKVKHIIFLIKLGKFIMYGVFVICLILMIIGV
jgi:hypothetical protein